MQRRTYTRTDILAIVLLGCMAIFVLRLFWLQVIKHDQYVGMAKQSQQRSFVIPATRGEVYMMDNGKPVPVVLNRTVYTMIADPEVVRESDRSKIVEELRDIAGGEMVDDAAGRLNNEGSRYEILARNITRNQAEKLKEFDFPGIGFQQTAIRNYPEGNLAAQVLGFVNTEGEGQYGVEQHLGDRLAGRDGLLQSVTDVRNVPLNVGKDNIRIEAKPGENLALTIDRNVQSFVEEALEEGIKKAGATEGSVMVMDPDNGEVLAMANYPTYNPGEYYKVKDASIFMNDSTMVPYEPASVIKTFTLATAIDKGAATPQSTYMNTDCIAVADRTMCNALRGLGGITTMQEVLNNSLNVGTITAARRLGDGKSVNLQARQVMYDYFHNKFGLGEKTGIEVGEVAGYIFPPDSAEGNEVRYSAMTYGQSLSLTMIQVATAFSATINGGEYYSPTLVAGTIDSDGQLEAEEHKPLRRSISESTSEQMRQMLVSARKSSWMGNQDKSGYMVGGKTGTAETIADDGTYTVNETVATYLGFGGSDRPEYVIMVRVAAPGKGLNLEGGVHAGPIFANVSNKMIDYMKLAPRR